MSSTEKTLIYELNQWELADKPQMADFNSDNEKIDTALNNISLQIGALTGLEIDGTVSGFYALPNPYELEENTIYMVQTDEMHEGQASVYKVINQDGDQVWDYVSSYESIVALADDAPLMNAIASAGTSDKVSRYDHVHPSDETKIDVSFLGIPNGVATLSTDGKLTPSQSSTAADIVLTGYNKPSSTSEILNTDTINIAIGKLEVAVSQSPQTTPGLDLIFTNTTVADNTWVADTTNSNAGFNFRAAVELSGVTASMTPAVVFNASDATDGNFAPVAESYNGGVYIYAREAAAVNIPTIHLMKGA